MAVEWGHFPHQVIIATATKVKSAELDGENTILGVKPWGLSPGSVTFQLCGCDQVIHPLSTSMSSSTK